MILESSKYDEIKDLYGGFKSVRKGSFWGIINDRGEEVVSCKYERVIDFHNGFCGAELAWEPSWILSLKKDGTVTFKYEIPYPGLKYGNDIPVYTKNLNI